MPSGSGGAASPRPHVVHGALLLAQLFFGLGGVVGALGLPSMNPLAFALFREVAAGALLLAASAWRNMRLTDEKEKIDALSWLRHRRNFAILGLLIFGNQAGYIIGIKMAGAIAGSVWQPSQPIMTAAICMARGWEKPDRRRISGVLVAFAGCAAMVLMSVKSSGEGGKEGDPTEIMTGSSARSLAGNLFFLFNCLCTSVYIIRSKRVLTLYPPLYVTAWSYNIASAFMLVAAGLASTSTGVMSALCPDCRNGAWHVPPAAVPALVYYIVFTSALSYSLMTWANQHVTGTLVMGYTVLQPVTAAVLTAALIASRAYPSCANRGGGGGGDEISVACLDPPGLGSLFGIAGVFAGLALVVMTEPGRMEDEKRGEYKPVRTEMESETGEAIEMEMSSTA